MAEDYATYTYDLATKPAANHPNEYDNYNIDDGYGPPWECTFCTYQNPTSLYQTCQACGQDRPRARRRGSALSHDDIEDLSDSFRRDLEQQHEIFRRNSMDLDLIIIEDNQTAAATAIINGFDPTRDNTALARRKSFDEIPAGIDHNAMSDSFRRDIQNQEELVRYSTIGMSTQGINSVAHFKKDTNEQELLQEEGNNKTRNGSIEFLTETESTPHNVRSNSMPFSSIQFNTNVGPIKDSSDFTESCIQDMANQEEIITRNLLDNNTGASNADFHGDFSDSFHRDIVNQDEIIRQNFVIAPPPPPPPATSTAAATTATTTTTYAIREHFPEAIHQDVGRQTEIGLQTLHTQAPTTEGPLLLRTMTSSFRRDLQRQSQIQEEIREGVITNPAPKIIRRYSMDSIGTGVAIGVSVEDSPLPPTPSYIKPNQFDADIFCSIVSKYLATEPPPIAPISSSLPSAASALLLHQREEYHTIERAEYQRMLEMLDSRKKEIEYDEGINMADAMQGASRPGVCSISPTVLEWISHDRMLKEWKKKMTRGSKKPVGGRN